MYTSQSWTVQSLWLAIQLISFKYFQTSTGTAVAAEAARVGQRGIAAANEERDVGELEEEEKDSSQYDAVGAAARARSNRRDGAE